ncbi:MAG: efflux RND transporter periplasmic adaptor subunit [Thermodesulfatator sp.]|nr:MAG: efflux RND transporter periplasmic adaptor subunit [Thermodesulfatator sp.]
MKSVNIFREFTVSAAARTTIVFISVLVLLVSGCGKEEKQQKREVIKPVKIMMVKDTATLLSHGFPGTVRASKRAVLSFKVSGPLVELPVEEGEHVREGDLIAQIDKRDFLNAVKEALAKFREAEQQFNRYKELYAKKQVSKADYDRYRAARDVALANLENARNALCDTTLRAPFDGVIAKRYVENFYKVKAKEPIVFLQDISRIEVLINVPELVMAAVRQQDGREIYATFESIPGKKFPLSVKEYSTEADPATQTYQVVLITDQPHEANILPGMTATVTMVYSPENNKGSEILVPALAVLDAPKNKPYVWVFDQDQGVVHRRYVKIGSLQDSAGIRITEGLKPGEIIVVAGVTKLKEGMKVRPWEKQRTGI